MSEHPDLTNRIGEYYAILSPDKHDGEEICPDEFNVLNHDVLLLEQIGSGSINGEAYKSCVPYDKETKKCENGILLSTKKIPLTQMQKYLYPYHQDKEELLNHENDAFVELACMQLCSHVILNSEQICPNLPLYYNYFLCNRCDYRNPEILKRNEYLIQKAESAVYLDKKGKEVKQMFKTLKELLKYKNKTILAGDDYKLMVQSAGQQVADIYKHAINDAISRSCILLINEFANGGDLKNWLKEDHSTLEWTVMYFHVFAGLYTLQKHFDLTHHDLHWGNVLVHKIKPGGFFNYKIDEKYYRVPNTGYLFTLWDFGYAYIPGKMQARDISFYSRIPNRYGDDYYRITNAIHWNMKIDKETNKPNGTVPKRMQEFFDIVTLLYTNNVPLKYTFEKVFKSFLSNEKLDVDYTIDDDVIPKVPKSQEWLLNTNENYKKVYPTSVEDFSGSFHELYSDLYRTFGDSTVEALLENV